MYRADGQVARTIKPQGALGRPTFAEMDALVGLSKLPRSPDEEAEANK